MQGNLFIRLLSTQIASYWEPIKLAAKATEDVEDKHLQAYMNELLNSLLCDKAQCWVRLDDNRQISLICLTRILQDKQRDEKYLYVQGVYSWKREPDEVWKQNLGILKDFAKQEGCSYVGCMSRVPRIWDVVKSIGFEESTRIFACRL